MVTAYVEKKNELNQALLHNQLYKTVLLLFFPFKVKPSKQVKTGTNHLHP